ncbi:MAG: polyphenol oxidase family protein [Actinomycetia bacterium]|nr:polyphenol oxidase family protein [Actinomycetes bacterium]
MSRASISTPISAGGAARIVFTDHRHGDLRVSGPALPLAHRRRAVIDRPWTWLRQIHSDRVVVVSEPGEHAGIEADAIVTRRTDVAIAAHSADCAPVAFVDPSGVIGVAHAGWKGLERGILARTVETMATQGAEAPQAWLGPCIHPAAYEFGADDLDRLARRFGDEVVGRTHIGKPALDLPAAVSAALEEIGVQVDTAASVCTGQSHSHWSHRARSDEGRQAVVVWIDPEAAPEARSAQP